MEYLNMAVQSPCVGGLVMPQFVLYHTKFLLENHYLQIHPSFDKLLTALRSAWAKDGVLDKEVTSFDGILDAFRLCLRPYREKSEENLIA
jgi:hypothetical protein